MRSKILGLLLAVSLGLNCFLGYELVSGSRDTTARGISAYNSTIGQFQMALSLLNPDQQTNPRSPLRDRVIQASSALRAAQFSLDFFRVSPRPGRKVPFTGPLIDRLGRASWDLSGRLTGLITEADKSGYLDDNQVKEIAVQIKTLLNDIPLTISTGKELQDALRKS